MHVKSTQRRRGQKPAIGTEIFRPGHVDGAGNTPGHRIDGLGLAAKPFGGANVDEHSSGLLFHQGIRVNDHALVGHAPEDRGFRIGHVGGHHQTCISPRLKPAIEHRHPTMSEPAHQPPQPNRHGATQVVVRHHLGPVFYTLRAEPARERLAVGKGVATGRRRHRTGKIAIQVCISRAGDMGLPIGALTLVRVGQIEAAIHHHPVLSMDVFGKRLRTDQGFVTAPRLRLVYTAHSGGSLQSRHALLGGRMAVMEGSVERIGYERAGVLAVELHQTAHQRSRVCMLGSECVCLELVSA